MKLKTCYIKNTVQNFPSHQLTTVEYTALSYGLDHQFPTRLNNSRIQFHQRFWRTSYIPENYVSFLKASHQNTCEKYSKIYASYTYKKIIEQLSRNKDLRIPKQDKGCNVVLIGRRK